MAALPENIVPFKLPDLELARSYPTVGPQGVHVMDVNGSAVAIEMFLGEHNLKDQNGVLRPVVWKGMVGKSRRYQGAIEDKESVAASFYTELKAPLAPEKMRLRYSDLAVLWEGIFRAITLLNEIGVKRENDLGPLPW